jgi:hypothetical protein
MPLLLALVLAMSGLAGPSAEAAKLPSKATWVSDVHTAMSGSQSWLAKRVAKENERKHPRKLAINFDIDNSAMASHYSPGDATPYVIELAQDAHRLGVALVFNTARVGSGLASARTLLTKGGYVVNRLCGRTTTKTPVYAGKQACRAKFISEGYKLIANIGNRSTDFSGPQDYGRAFRLPNYNNQLT